VGSTPKGNGRWGHCDLAGNLREWNLDKGTPYSTSQTENYAGTSSGQGRVFRGGAFVPNPALGELRAASRYGFGDPPHHYPDAGLRCARAFR
jgi:formylglycine-generating enzyme required for sulfatase activity